MIRVKITKNIIRKGEIGFGLTLPQIIIGVAGIATGIGMFLLLKDVVSINLLMTLIFIVMALFIMGGVVRMQGMPLFSFLLQAMKGVDVRPYATKGVFDDGSVPKEKKH